MKKIQSAFEKKNIVWRQHALERMLERKISRKDVSHILKNGEMIESYPSASPYPGFLISGVIGKKRIHVVVAWDESADSVYVITAYIPDMEHFQENGITRKERK
ncbi:MAG: DUF4258 domain-containing protein [Desulfotignum sp.]|nr:DUF4258 domain-containing protein [Desulfotignum sp.]MCF8114565.1 DUF4258 domain-containing protein [Desulfotignum sp.]